MGNTCLCFAFETRAHPGPLPDQQQDTHEPSITHIATNQERQRREPPPRTELESAKQAPHHQHTTTLTARAPAATQRHSARSPAMVRCDLDGFLSQLHKLYERNKATGTVWVTMKRSALRRGPHRPSSAPPPAGDAGGKNKRAPKPQAPIRDDECVCLVRATDGKRKISAEIRPAQLAKFKASYQLLLRAHAGEGLKKREKKAGGGSSAAAAAAAAGKAGGGKKAAGAGGSRGAAAAGAAGAAGGGGGGGGGAKGGGKK